MRDAIGSTFMFRLIIIFIVFYVSFAAIAANYAKTFRLKNEVIDLVEQYQIKLVDKKRMDTSMIDDYLSKNAYRLGNVQAVINDCKSHNGVLSENGVCFSYDVNNDYYNVTLYILIDLPFVGSWAFPITGHTKNFGQYTHLSR